MYFFLTTTLLDEIYEKGVANDQYINVTNVNISSSYVNNFFVEIIQLLTQTSLLIGVAIFIYGGIRFILSQGDYSKMKKARTDLIIAGAGIFIVLLSYSIIVLIKTITKGLNF